MNRQERRAAEAAQAASDAGRVLQAARQEKTDANEPNGDDTQPTAVPKMDDTRQRMLEGLYEGRKKAAQKIVEPADMPPGLPPEEVKEPTDEEREAEEVRKATKAREEAAKKQQKADEDKPKTDAAPQQPVENVSQAPDVPRETSTTSKQKVDGVEYDVPLAEIEEAGSEKAWRINKAAQNRLEKANEATAQAKAMQAQVAAWMQANAPKPAPTPSADELLKTLAANRFGTDEEFASSLKATLGQLIPKVDENAILLKATASIKRDDANAKFSTEFSDVLANPLVKKLALQMEGEALSPHIQNGQINWTALAQLDWNNFYSTIGTQLRSVIGQRQSQPTVAPAANASGNPSQLSEREARKASIVNLPQAAAARAVAPAEEKPETREEALNRMRKSRGIPTG